MLTFFSINYRCSFILDAVFFDPPYSSVWMKKT